MKAPLIQLEKEHLTIIQTILRRHLPANHRVWVFGSRVKGSARPYSDIDLVVNNNGKNVGIEIISDLQADFEESDLPFPVDIVDWNSINEDFQNLIKNEKIPLEF